MVVKIERPRYFLVEFFTNVPTKKALVKALREIIGYLYGQINVAKSGIHVIDIHQNFAIIKSNHDFRDIVEASIQLLDFSDSIPVVRTVSGTIKKINKIINTDFYEEFSDEDL